MYNQTISPAAAPSAAGTVGGVNPKQIGLGVQVSAIDVLHTQGATQTTDKPLDLMIDGEGFFPVINGDDIFYTRAGNFYLDPYGYLVTANGLYVQGVMLLEEYPSDFVEETVAERIESDERIQWLGEDALEELTGEDGTFPYTLSGAEAREELFGTIGRVVIPLVYTAITIDQTGLISAINEEGNLISVGMLVTTTFINPAGLDKVGQSLYRESANSGMPSFATPGMSTNGLLMPGALEMSNVDLSKEFTDMIITQRGFQANSRIITVSDTLLEELVNLKR
jgi:flagellar hook protein FlgE